MRRDNYSLDSANLCWVETDEPPTRPLLRITVEDQVNRLRKRLTGPNGRWLSAEEIDVAFRFQSPVDAGDPSGVISLANRTRGDFILESQTAATLIEAIVSAARRYASTTDADDCYQIRLQTTSTTLVTYTNRTLLIYAQDGTLLRHRSLIPAGIEL
jgi:hypothetical protein